MSIKMKLLTLLLSAISPAVLSISMFYSSLAFGSDKKVPEQAMEATDSISQESPSNQDAKAKRQICSMANNEAKKNAKDSPKNANNVSDENILFLRVSICINSTAPNGLHEIALIDPTENYLGISSIDGDIRIDGNTLFGGMPASDFMFVIANGTYEIVPASEKGAVLIGVHGSLVKIAGTEIAGSVSDDGRIVTWNAGDGACYQYTSYSKGSETGSLSITGGMLAKGARIVIRNFNLTIASNTQDTPTGEPAGFLGIKLKH